MFVMLVYNEFYLNIYLIVLGVVSGIQKILYRLGVIYMDKVFSYVQIVLFQFQYGGRLDVEKIVIVLIDGQLLSYVNILYVNYYC